MAQTRIPLLTSFLILTLTTPFSSSSSHDHQLKFQLLDVSGSLQQARRVFSGTSSSLRASAVAESHRPALNSSSSILSLSLHPRSSLPQNNNNNNNDNYDYHNNNYTHLTLARLARDKARVQSVHSRATFGYLRPAQFGSPLVSGLRQGSGEYFARIGMGRPARDLYLIADTGSDVSWIQCRPCVDCYDQSDPIYDPSASTTYKDLPCNSGECNALRRSACRVNTCRYQVAYGDGSYTVGSLATETISFVPSGASVSGVAIGCGHNNVGLFSGAAGLLGLGGGPLSLPSQLHSASFSYCLVNRDSASASTLDFGSEPPPPPDSIFAPLIRNPFVDTFWYVGLAGISIGGRRLPIPPSLFKLGRDRRGGVIVDSGTAVTRFPREVYRVLRDAFVGMATGLPRTATGFSLFDTCYDLSGLRRVSVPAVSFEFTGGRGTWRLPAANYMVPVDGLGKFCLAFAGMEGTMSIIGNMQQQGTRVVYDVANRRIAFSPNKC
ncbi:eukaryotic aspartyl protease family protein [Striga asiatica]|uniref:Eukaryotic aspartyl protease family protein n=1 Tax=Striga asiatica TaxID=4170 RepID=A0A5A7Q0G3_STRAF|nr:eukaryotic aspartyl protease family protein [Striga asiatica]